MPSMMNSRASSVVIAQAPYTLLPANLQSRKNDALRRSRIQTDKAPGNSLVSTTQSDKKKHARKRRATVGCVQLHQSRAARSAGPPTSFATCYDRRGTEEPAAAF